MPRSAQAASNPAMNSAPLSTLMARTSNGIRSARASRMAAAAAVARRPSSRMSQRLTTSRAVNCLKTGRCSGRTSRVSTWTRSPGRSTVVGRLADRVRPPPSPLVDADPPPARLAQLTRPRQAGEDPADHRGGQETPCGAAGRRACPCPSADSAPGWLTARSCSIVQPGRRRRRGAERGPRASRAEPVVAGQPAIDRRSTEAEVAGRAADVAAVGPMPVEHREPAARPAQVRRGPTADPEPAVRSGGCGRWCPGDERAAA